MGAGGIGVDVAVWLTHTPESDEEWLAHWGVGDPSLFAGGLTEPKPREPARQVFLLQRKASMIGKDLGKTSGWAHRAVLKQSGVTQIKGVSYDRIDDQGLHIRVDGTARALDVDHVVICAGQEPVRDLYDAKRAIRQGTELAASAR